jgi:hypothetical protein
MFIEIKTLSNPIFHLDIKTSNFYLSLEKANAKYPSINPAYRFHLIRKYSYLSIFLTLR